MDERTRQFEALFEDHSDAVFRHLYFRLGDRERAKELTQEVFMRTWQYLASGKEISYEKAFLFKVARNLFINDIRTDKSVDSLEQINERSGFEPAEPSPGPVEYSQAQEILRYLDKLQPNYREVIIMRFIDGLPVKDIAESLNEKENNISMRIMRALDKLKEEYENDKN